MEQQPQNKNELENEVGNEKFNDLNVIKKKRGRKPKNLSIEENIIVEKKKRGRKKKYEIENFNKIVNRESINNFDHNIVYSSDEEIVQNNNVNNDLDVNVNENNESTNHIKKISFGNLNITVSKKNGQESIENNNNINTFKGLLKEHKPITSQIINEDELESDEEKEVLIENIINIKNSNSNSNSNEKVFKENKKYVTDFTESIKEQSVKRLRVVTCCKNVIKDNEWPTKCDICCWWCCHKFDNIPCTIPTNYDPHRKRYTFMGIFCSWNCAKSYNFNMVDHKKQERNTLLTLLIKDLYGIQECLNIKVAPPREALKMFGGYLDIEEFRSRYDKVSSYYINLPSNLFIFPEISEITNIKIKPQVTSNNNINDKKNLRLHRNN
jgi:hypothetical protein